MAAETAPRFSSPAAGTAPSPVPRARGMKTPDFYDATQEILPGLRWSPNFK